MRRLAALSVLLLLTIPTVALADHGTLTPQGNCPVEGKVESVVDGDLDNIVLAAGTHVCIKGGQTTMLVTTNGEDTLVELLGTGQNVSHYTIIQQPPTTAPTTTTTVAETTTTTVAETTTTTSQTTTTQPTFTEQTTTTVAECPPGMVHQPPFCVEPAEVLGETTTPTVGASSVAGETVDVLPFTGANTATLALSALGLLLLGGALLRVRAN